MSMLGALTQLGQGGAGRSAKVIDADVVAELRSHLEMRARDNMANGMSAEEARADAERRFGDFESIRRQCRSVHLRERLVAQWAVAVMLVMAVASIGVLSWRASASQRENARAMRELGEQVARLSAAVAPITAREGGRASVNPEEVLAEINAAKEWRGWAAAANRVAALPSERGLEIARNVFSSIAEPKARQQFLKAFALAWKPNVVQVMHLGATDPDPSVRAWAFGYLKHFAFVDLSASKVAYDAWWQEWGHRPLAELLAGNARALVARAAAAEGVELRSILRRGGDDLDRRASSAAGIELAVVLRDAGALDLVEKWLASDDDDVRTPAAKWLDVLEPDEAYARRVVIPRLLVPATTSSEEYIPLARCLGRKGNAWAVEPLLDALVLVPAGEQHKQMGIAQSLAAIGEPRAVPTLIGVLAADGGPEAPHSIGWYGLHDLTGVSYDESHGGAWWRAWWEENRERFPAEVRSRAIPEITLPKAGVAG